MLTLVNMRIGMKSVLIAIMIVITSTLTIKIVKMCLTVISAYNGHYEIIFNEKLRDQFYISG